MRHGTCLALFTAVVVAACSSVGTDDTPDAGLTGGDASIDPNCGRNTTPCPPGGTCEGASDCADRLCRDGECRETAPADGVKNGDETDVDCGGTKAPACDDGKGCLVPEDCTSQVCDPASKTCSPPSPTDGVANGDETDVDCGGASAPKCTTGQGCKASADCDEVLCDAATATCAGPAYDDGIENGDETGVDCGGPAAPNRCPPGQGCASDADCAATRCHAGTLVCDPPSATDGLKNGTESDVDCGGAAPTNAPKCLIGRTCAAGTDCESGGCSAALGNTCSPLSCATAEVAGIDSCGAKETGEAGAAHESCCTSLVLPTRTNRRLDKYEITAGRFRTFLTKVGPNVRAWVSSYIAANPTSQLARLIKLAPQVFPDGSDLRTIYPNADTMAPHSLTAHMVIDIDNYGGIRGCYNGDGDYSANTYWMDAAHEAEFGLPPRSLDRKYSDEKPLNCAMPMMYAAFCAWDGGELAMLADYHDAWKKPPNNYPWGPTDILRPNYNWCNGTYKNGNFTCQCDGVHNIGSKCPAGGFSTNGQAGVFYEFPIGTDRSKDNEPLIAAPGRFVNDATVQKSDGQSWMDVYGNLVEYTGDFRAATSDWCDFSAAPAVGDPTCTRNKHSGTGTHYTHIPTTIILGVSWEGHQYNWDGRSREPVTFQYGKFGARCVRPASPY